MATTFSSLPRFRFRFRFWHQDPAPGRGILVPERRGGRRGRLMAVGFVALALVGTVAGPVGAEPNEGATAAAVDNQRVISAGGLHTCAVLDTGAVQCWGANDNGQLGNNTNAATTVPRPVQGISTAVGVSGGSTHTCALLYGGTVECWGNNGSGQLGNDRTSPPDPPVLTPVAVVGLDDATAIAAGGFHTCAVRSGGGVACWGHDGSGQLGDGGGIGTAYKPVAVVHDHDNDNGATTPDVPLTGATAVVSGEYHSCAVLGSSGKVLCWGHNAFGQLGNGATLPAADSTKAVEVTGIPDAEGDKALAVTAGQAHTCAVLEDNAIRCWGQGFFGQLGNNTSGDGTDTSTPVEVLVDVDGNPTTTADIAPLGGVVAVTAGQFHTCARRTDGTVRCWGQNGRAQLGDNTTTDRKMPVLVSGLGSVRAVTAGGFHTCVLRSTNGMRCWGYNFYGQLGAYRSASVTPVTVTALSAATHVTTGDGHACALVTTADVPPNDKPVCWGNNLSGELGSVLTPAANNTTIPVAVSGIADIGDPAPPPPAAQPDLTPLFSAGNEHACAIPQGTGTPKCWGRNTDGELGNGTNTSSPTPVNVSGVSNATQIAAGGELDPVSSNELGHTCVRRSTGTAACWGANGFGQLGDETTTNRNAPVTVRSDHDDDHLNTPPPALTPPQDLTGVVQVATGGRHSCALLTSGRVRCWGRNFDGQLGDGTTTDRAYAVTVDTDPLEPDPDETLDKHFVPLEGIVAITAGARHTCALKNDDTLWCWGRDADGQLGDGTAGSARDVPVQVTGLPTVAWDLLAISAGDFHTCARVLSKPAGFNVNANNTSVLCWGDNAFGQLGRAGGDSAAPVEPDGLGEPDGPVRDVDLVKSVGAARRNTCAVLIETSVMCWGDNAHGQLGDGVGASWPAPIDVANLASVGGNHIPAPVDDAATTAPGNAVNIAVLANDTDADGTALTVSGIKDAPARGSAVVNGGATITYTPNADFCTVDPTSNVDTFRYNATDGTATVWATVTVTVTCPNTAPTAADDSATTAEEQAATVDVLANDSDINGQAISVGTVGTPANGTAVVDSGKIKYTPAADFFGTDTFTYTASDGIAQSAPATVTVTVTNVNDAPVATDDAVSLAEDGSVTFDPTVNDTDTDGPSMAVTAVTDAPHGHAMVDGPTSITYTPDAGYCGTDGFTYTLSDGNSTDTANVSVTITCTNDGPNAVDDSATTAEDTAVAVDVLANDTDPEGDSLTITGVAPAPEHGATAITGGTITYTPAQDFCGADTFGYTVSDGSESDSAMVVPVVVLCVNDAPSANDDAAVTAEDTPADLDVVANDTDPDGNAVKVVSASDPAHGTTTVRSTGLVSYNPDADYCGTDTFTYEATDTFGGNDTATVTVTVSCVNDAPVVAAIGDTSVPWGEDLVVPVAASDVDAGDTVTWSTGATPAGTTVSEVSPGSFALVWTPPSTAVGTHTVIVRATDASGAWDDEELVVTVTKRATALTYTGDTSAQYSDPAALRATLVDFEGNPVGDRWVGFALNGRSATGVTDASTGVADSVVVTEGGAGPTTVTASFVGDSAYLPSSTSAAFTVTKELVTTSFTGAHVTTTTGTSASVQLSATVTEEADGSLGMGGSTLQVTFTQVGGGVLCTAPVSTSPSGTGTASCTASGLGLGSRAVVVSVSSGKFAGPVDVGAFVVAQALSGSALGGGRVEHGGGTDDFAFQARPVRKSAPTGDAVHVRRVGGVAIVGYAGTLSSLSSGCSGGKNKVCTAVVEGAAASRWQVDLATGAVSALGGTAALRIDATDAVEPDGAGVDRYAVSLGAPDSYSLGTPAAPLVITTGNIRVIP